MSFESIYAILYAYYILQIDLGNAYLLVAQQPGQCIDIHTVF